MQTLTMVLLGLIIVVATFLHVCIARKREKMMNYFIQLWIDHVYWTRLFIVSVLNNHTEGDVNSTLNRLMKNQEEIGNCFSYYYGSKVGDTVTHLLKDHISIAGEIVNNVKSNVDPANTVSAWYNNSDAIVNALCSVNSGFSKEKLTMMMKFHLENTINEVLSYVSGDYNASIVYFDKLEHEIVEMAKSIFRVNSSYF